mmetsp:Transcript_39614/g.64844  ORF Transcript_39614/g.64844 Transcript_39614/m.64844 type:complete len:364 (+) Transcript_39614:12-1103(+)
MLNKFTLIIAYSQQKITLSKLEIQHSHIVRLEHLHRNPRPRTTPFILRHTIQLRRRHHTAQHAVAAKRRRGRGPPRFGKVLRFGEVISRPANVPDAHRAVLSGHGERRAARAEGHGVDHSFRVARRRRSLLLVIGGGGSRGPKFIDQPSISEIPNPDNAIVSGPRRISSRGRNSHQIQTSYTPRKKPHAPSGLYIEHPTRLIVAGRHHIIAVGMPRDAIHAGTNMAAQHTYRRGPIRRPNAGRVVRPGRGEIIPRRGGRHGPHGRGRSVPAIHRQRGAVDLHQRFGLGAGNDDRGEGGAGRSADGMRGAVLVLLLHDVGQSAVRSDGLGVPEADGAVAAGAEEGAAVARPIDVEDGEAILVSQ